MVCALALAGPKSHSDAQFANSVATVLRCAVCAWIRRVALRSVVTPAANLRASRLAQLLQCGVLCGPCLAHCG
eukprot:1880602-Pyramimonas_sp.AAC.1